MVEFNGTCRDEVISQTKKMRIADNNKVKVRKQELTTLIILLIISIPLCYFVGYCMHYVAYGPPGWEKVGAFFGIFFGLVPALGFVVVSVIMVTKTFYRHNDYILWDYHIRIENGFINWNMYTKNGHLEAFAVMPFSEIAKVVETDICYYIYFKKNSGMLTSVIVCDKSTLTAGSFEELTQHFKSIKIIRKSTAV